jgi:hypothetical protein
MVLTVSFALSSVTGLFCHRHQRTSVVPKPGRADITSANLTPASGRQDHTTSPYAGNISRPRAVDSSQAHHPPCNPVARNTLPRPPHPHPASVTIAIRPLCGVGWREFVEMICPTGEAKYFCKGGSTAPSTKRPTGKSPDGVESKFSRVRTRCSVLHAAPRRATAPPSRTAVPWRRALPSARSSGASVPLGSTS